MLKCFPLVKEAWSRVCGYDCIVVYVGNELPDVLKQEKYKNSVFFFLNRLKESILHFKPSVSVFFGHV